jgi:hypothetical protein
VAERVADAVRDHDDPLDDITRRRMASTLGEAFERHFERRERRLLKLGRVRRLGWLVATAGLTALGLVVGWKWLAPAPAPTSAVSRSIDPNLIYPYLVAGPTLIGEETRSEALPLGEGYRAVSAPAQGRLWADLGRAGRIALLGPGRVSVLEATSKQVRLELEGGRLVGRVDPREGVQLEVLAGGVTVAVVGTVFAVEASADGRVSVLRGEVKIRDDDGVVVPVAAGQTWSPRGRVTLGRRQARRLLAEARPLAVRPTRPDAARDGTLILTGGPLTAGVRLGRDDRWLGTLPLATRLPAGEHTLLVQARGHRPQVVRVRIEAGRTSRREVHLQRAPRHVAEDEPVADAAIGGEAPSRPETKPTGQRPTWRFPGDLARIAREVHRSKESLARVRARTHTDTDTHTPTR